MNINKKIKDILRRIPADINDSSIDAIHQSLHKLYDDAKVADISDEDLAFLQTAFGCQSEDETRKTLALYRVYDERTQIQELLITSLDDCFNTWLSSGDMDKDTIVNFIFDAIMEQPRFQYILASSPEVARSSIDPVALKSRLKKMFNNRIEDESIHYKMGKTALSSAQEVRLGQILQKKRELGLPNSTYDIGFRMSLDLNPLGPPTSDMSLQEVLFPHRHAFRRLGSDVKDSRVVKQYQLSKDTAHNYRAILESSDISYETRIGFLSAISPTLIRHASNKDQARETIADFNKYMLDPASSGYRSGMTKLIADSLLDGDTVVALHLTKEESMLFDGFPGITALTAATKALPITEHGREVDEIKWYELENNKDLIESGRVYFSPEGQLQSWDPVTNAFKDMDTESRVFKGASKEAGLIITTDQKMYCFDHLYGRENSRGLIAFHSMISSGRPVMYAGSIKVTNGKIKYISDLSGHFKPRSSSLQHLAIYLANHNMLTTDISTNGIGVGSTKLVSLFKKTFQAQPALEDLLAAPDLTETGKQCIVKIVRHSIKSYDQKMNHMIKRLLEEEPCSVLEHVVDFSLQQKIDHIKKIRLLLKEPLWDSLRAEIALDNPADEQSLLQQVLQQVETVATPPPQTWWQKKTRKVRKGLATLFNMPTPEDIDPHKRNTIDRISKFLTSLHSIVDPEVFKHLITKYQTSYPELKTEITCIQTTLESSLLDSVPIAEGWEILERNDASPNTFTSATHAPHSASSLRPSAPTPRMGHPPTKDQASDGVTTQRKKGQG
ncbi:hypothetical protein [Candidatus Synchoanobacter obligatus]|uniref:FHA domain-containing protein n=1 Tax=Candidatus Synchoanobacter obligatus TaxID=2919597 RepID=A0ABT1L6Q9_9GAMM|nr:hypothetical protein [Candidatus Synchoanobacter obligatus]MCP8352395.1 hypothetical protein [Candidatus Synchoanobacter obligatus]